MKTLRIVRNVAFGGLAVAAGGGSAFAQTESAGGTAVSSVFTAVDLNGMTTQLNTSAGGIAIIIMASIAAFGVAWKLTGKARRIGS